MLTLQQPPKGFRYSVDAVLVAASVRLKKNDCILDAGAGVGAVGLHVAHRASYQDIPLHIDFCENNELYSSYCKKNIQKYAYDCIKYRLCETNYLTMDKNKKQYDYIVSNPPFHMQEQSDLSPYDERNSSKIISYSDFQKWISQTISLLKPHGRASLIIKPDQLDVFYQAIPKHGVEIVLLPCIDFGKKKAKRLIIGIKNKRGSSAKMKTHIMNFFSLHNDKRNYTKRAQEILFEYQKISLWD